MNVLRWIRVRSRNFKPFKVHADYLPYDVRFPIILLRRNWVTKLIIEAHHKKPDSVIIGKSVLNSAAKRRDPRMGEGVLCVSQAHGCAR